MRKHLLALMICCTFLVPTSAVYAANAETTLVATETLTENKGIHYLTESLTRGSKKPKSSASVHDLDVNDYNYQLTNFGYRLYTDKWLKSTSGEITVSLDSFSTIEEYGGTNNKITFILYDNKGKKVDSSEETVYSGTASTTFSDISSSKKYYVCFEVPTNGNRYTGSGSISN